MQSEVADTGVRKAANSSMASARTGWLTRREIKHCAGAWRYITCEQVCMRTRLTLAAIHRVSSPASPAEERFSVHRWTSGITDDYEACRRLTNSGVNGRDLIDAKRRW